MSNTLTDFVSKLGTLAEEPADYWDGYELSSKPQVPLDPGIYVVTVPMIGEKFKPGATKPDSDNKSYFQYEMDPTVVYPSNCAGRELRFVRLSIKKSKYRQGSLAGDLVTVTGIGAMPRNNNEWLQIMGMLQGQEFGVEVDLRVWDSNAKKEVFGPKSQAIPKNADGTFRTRFVYKQGILLSNPTAEQEALAIRDAGGPAASAITVLYANNNIVRIMKADEVRELRKEAA